jgi:acetoin utilization protein AcuC
VDCVLKRTALVWDDLLTGYRFTPEHPLNPRRLELTVELMQLARMVGDEAHPVVSSRLATDEELLGAHSADFIAAVRRASSGDAPAAGLQLFGLGSPDVPIFPGMHEAASRVAGATLVAAELVMGGAARRAFSIAGGLHHARRSEAAGFCVYNDLAVAIRWLQRAHGARVMYLDIDAHHGDGVQWIFYDDPDVLTVSWHESGAFLFPGTGFIDELGEGDGYGYSVNVPFDPHTEDESFLGAVADLLPQLAAAFGPDVIVLQAGCDAHVLDPLTHLRCTTGLYQDIVRLVGEVADLYCEGRIIMTGGGGYALHTVVPRAWALAWAALCEVEPPAQVPAGWLDRARSESGEAVPSELRDAPGRFPASQRTAEAALNNRRTVDAVRTRCLPLVTGWGLGF